MSVLIVPGLILVFAYLPAALFNGSWLPKGDSR